MKSNNLLGLEVNGFSLIEIMVAVAFLMVGSTVAVIEIHESMAGIDADKAANLVMAELRYARQVAVDERRTVDVAFVGNNRIIVTRRNRRGSTTLLENITLPAGYVFGLPSGISDDTDEGYGNAQAVNFNTATSGSFLPDGVFASSTGNVLNGTVFTIGSGNRSARAVTLTGASGQLKQYYLQTETWIGRN